MQIDQEVAILAGLVTGSSTTELEQAERSLAELAELAEAAGARVTATVLQRRASPDSAYFLGKGKLEEVMQAATEVQAPAVETPAVVAEIETPVTETPAPAAEA